MTSSLPPQDTAAFEDCPNCQGILHGPYCSACGQRNNHERLDTKELIVQAVDEFFGLDTALWRTLKGLTVAPGRLIADYVEGHRRTHVGPFRYAVVSVLIVMSLVSLSPAAQPAVDDTLLPAGLVAPELAGAAESLAHEFFALALRYGRAFQLLMLPINALAFGLAFGGLSWLAGLRVLKGRMKKPRERNQAELFCFATFVFAHTNLAYGLPLVLASFVLPPGGLAIGIMGGLGSLFVLAYGAWAAMVFFEVGILQGLIGNVVGSVLVMAIQILILALIVGCVALGLN